MNKRLTERERLHSKLDCLTETEVAEVLDYVALIESAKQTPNMQTQSRLFPDPAEDDLVTMLSTAYENRRARQVIEWEATRRRAESMASKTHFARP
jgi:hypothetical protein